MAQITKSQLFNGPIEIGLRSLVLLFEAYPDSLDLQHLVAFDYIMVHSGDIDAELPSLHPAVPLRGGEIAVKRNLLEQGLQLYILHGLIQRNITERGITYQATDEASLVIDGIKSEYFCELRTRAEWVYKRFGKLSDKRLAHILNTGIGKWKTEFAVLGGTADEQH